MKRPRETLKRTFDSQVQNLALSLRANSVLTYRTAAYGFLGYLTDSFPELGRLEQLRRDPHVLGWLRTLAERTPPYKSSTRRGYVIRVRRLLQDLASNPDHSCPPNLIIAQDLPRLDAYLPKALSPEDDRLLDPELRKKPDLSHTGLRLLRATGMRIGECVSLPTDCLRQLGQNQWALRVPLGKLHNERWLPVDDEIRSLIARLLWLRAQPPHASTPSPKDLLFPQPHGHLYACEVMRRALSAAARRAGCSTHITPHQLRHTFATEMLRAGMSLPALKALLGHRDIRMTLRYIHVTQNDLQVQYLQARQKIAHLYPLPKLPFTRNASTSEQLGIRTICESLAAARHQIEMYRRQVADNRIDNKLRRLTSRLDSVAKKIHQLDSAPK